MKVRTTLNYSDLEDIAGSINLKLYDYKEVGHWKQFVLKPLGKQYRTRGFWNKNKHNWAVCLHGYTLFMLLVFMVDYEAVFKSSMATVTIDNIDDVYNDIRYNNVGSIIEPLYYEDKCFCTEAVRIMIEELLFAVSKIYILEASKG